MSVGNTPDGVHRFLLEALDIRGALVQLGPCWQAMQGRREYAPSTRALLGELAAVASLIGCNLKAPGRLCFQLQGNGPVSMLVMDCDQQLRLRGMARQREATMPEHGILRELLGDGQLAMTLHTRPDNAYQSIVPLLGDSLGAAFEHFLGQSEQQPARLWLAADTEMACGLFLQKLPGADALDPDGWSRIEALAATVQPAELKLPPAQLLGRLFAEETVRLFDPRPVAWHCPRDEDKVKDLLLSLGRDEVESMLADADVIAVEDEICGHEYRFGAEIINELFPPTGRLLH